MSKREMYQQGCDGVEAEGRGVNVRKRRVVGYIRVAGLVCLTG